MDENNMNPMPMDPVKDENNDTQPLTDASEVASDSVASELNDTAEANDEMNDAENAEPETDADTVVEEDTIVESDETAATEEEAVTTDSESEEAVSEENEETAEPVKKKKMGKGAKAAIVFLVLLLIVAVTSMVAVIIKSNASKIDLEQVAVSVGDVDSSAAEFYQAYLYYYGYNSYYQYSDEELKDLAIDQLVLTNSLYVEALANGYTVTDEIQSQIDEQINSITVTAEASSMTADEYLDEAFCKGFTLEMFKTIVEKSMIAQTYYTDKMTAIEKQYEDDDGLSKIEAEYKANKVDYDLTDVSYWYFEASDENAQSDADAVVAQVKNGKTFTDAIISVTGDSEAIPNNLKGHSKTALETGKFSEEAIKWFFAENEDGTYKNGTGAVTSIAADDVVYVFYVNNAPGRDETHPVDMYYIQVDVSTDDSIKTEKELRIEAKAAAERILKDFEATDMSEKSFINLLTECENGDNDLVSGDIFEGLKNDGTEDPAVESWAFDDARKKGDYALIESDDCYYILFFNHKAETAIWYNTIMSSLINNEAMSFEENLLAESEEKTVVNEDVINEVINYVKNVIAAQYGY